MIGFDAELYLRLRGEDQLLGGASRPHVREPLEARARALVGVRLIELDRAQEILDDYRRASALRGHHDAYWRQALGPGDTPPPRVAGLNASIEQGDLSIQLHTIVLDRDRTSLSVRMTSATGSLEHRMHRHGPMQLRITDDSGGPAVSAHFSGGGSDDEWTGSFEVDRPLPVDTRWIAVEGHRVDLEDPADDVSVTITDFPADSLVADYVDRILASLHPHRDDQELDVVLETFVAARILTADDPLVSDALAVRRALSSHRRSGRPGAVPQRWAHLSPAGRRRRRGARCHRLLGVSVELDDMRAVLIDLSSDPDRTQLSVLLRGATLDRDSAAPLRAPRPFLAATDDRGGRYAGSVREWSGGPGDHEATVELRPPLDPDAGRLDFAIGATTQQAVVSIPLRWEPLP